MNIRCGDWLSQYKSKKSFRVNIIVPAEAQGEQISKQAEQHSH